MEAHTEDYLLCCTGTLPNPEDGSEREYVRPPKPLSVPVSADKAERTRVHELCRHPKLPKVTTQTIQEDPERPLIELSFHYKVISRSPGQLSRTCWNVTALQACEELCERSVRPGDLPMCFPTCWAASCHLLQRDRRGKHRRKWYPGNTAYQKQVI